MCGVIRPAALIQPRPLEHRYSASGYQMLDLSTCWSFPITLGLQPACTGPATPVIQHPIHHQLPEHDQQRYAQQRQALRRGMRRPRSLAMISGHRPAVPRFEACGHDVHTTGFTGRWGEVGWAEAVIQHAFGGVVITEGFLGEMGFVWRSW